MIDDFDRRVVKTYMDEYMGDFIFDTFQPFHFYNNEEVDYFIPKPEKGTLLTDNDWNDPFPYLQNASILGFHPYSLTSLSMPIIRTTLSVLCRPFWSSFYNSRLRLFGKAYW